MSFLRVRTPHHAAAPLAVRIGLRLAPTRAPGIQLSFRIGDIAARLLRLAPGERLELQWGVGEDVGRLWFAPGGGRNPVLRRERNGSSLRANFGHLPREPLPGADGRTWRLLLERQAVVVCPHNPHPVRGLVVDLPEAWFEVRPAAPCAIARNAGSVALARRGAA